MIPTEWQGHRRASDGELVGYLVPGDGQTWTPVTVFGLAVDDALDRDDAERRLDEVGLSHLADRWLLERPGRPEPIVVRIVEADPSVLRVASVDFGADVEYGTVFALDVPVDGTLRRA
ncbi:hypothetical protein [Pseudonocardia endophytica]|uniref:Uncharacterized protein n=1 Tax=Pseudonocardia endophytica TaxID=401976 RepID=A0A4R1HY96_PSEEN|nr:hypothetical protein [Pseudonocardia endophytica]TCK22542.1 hypothetical protein EV378_6548 [Pseudonocardia endophytica]